MYDPRASTGHRAERLRPLQREAPRHVRSAPDSNGHRPTARPGDAFGYSDYRRDYYGRDDPSVAERNVVSWPAITAIALVVAANIFAITGTQLQPVSSTIGLWFILLYP